MIVQIVRFISALDDTHVAATYRARAPRYREVPGLLQKYYLSFASGQHGAVYVWESDEAMQAFRQTDLARTIAEAYQVQGDAQIDVAEVVLTLHPSASAEA